MLGLIVIAIYFLAMIAIGLASRRWARGADDFFVAGRGSSTLFVTGSLLATIIGGSAVMVTSSLGFTRGLSGAWWLLVGSVGLIVLGIFLAKKVRKFGLYTLPELVEKQYNKWVALAGSILIVVAWIGVIGAQIIAAGNIMSVLGIGDFRLWMTIFTVIFILYTVLGGQHAILRTDTLQTLIIFAGIFGTFALVFIRFGGWSGLMSVLTPERFSFPTGPQFGNYDFVNLLLLVGLTYLVGPDMYSRLFCAKDAGTARKSVFWAALLIIPFALAITIIGMGASALFPHIASNQAFPMVIKEVLSPVWGSIVLAALLCAFMSSADTCLMTASTILSVDIVGRFKPSLDQRKILLFSRWGIVVLGVASLILALYLAGIVTAILFAFTVYTAGLILPVLAGFYKDKLKVTPVGALAAIIGGGGVALVSKLLQIKYLDLGGLLASGVLLFLVSFIDKRMRSRRLDEGKSV
jgi:SSS family solute:Na+ symporter